MKNQLTTTYGRLQTIRYLVASIDDLRETAETVKFIIKQNCRKEDYPLLMQSINIAAIPLPQSLSSFILGLDVPRNILNKTQIGTQFASSLRESGAISTPNTKSSDNPPDSIKLKIRSAHGRSQIESELMTLEDLVYMVNATILLLRSNSKRFEYLNLKRRTRMKVKPLENSSHGFTLIFQVPEVLANSS